MAKGMTACRNCHRSGVDTPLSVTRLTIRNKQRTLVLCADCRDYLDQERPNLCGLFDRHVCEPPVPKPPVADHLVCMECGAHIQHGFVDKHYASVHPNGLTDQDIRRLAHDLHVREQSQLIRDAVADDPAFLTGPEETTT